MKGKITVISVIYSQLEIWLIFCLAASLLWRKGKEKGEGLPTP
jgi:hypothetical protein